MNHTTSAVGLRMANTKVGNEPVAALTVIATPTTSIATLVSQNGTVDNGMRGDNLAFRFDLSAASARTGAAAYEIDDDNAESQSAIGWRFRQAVAVVRMFLSGKLESGAKLNAVDSEIDSVKKSVKRKFADSGGA